MGQESEQGIDNLLYSMYHQVASSFQSDFLLIWGSVFSSKLNRFLKDFSSLRLWEWGPHFFATGGPWPFSPSKDCSWLIGEWFQWAFLIIPLAVCFFLEFSWSICLWLLEEISTNFIGLGHTPGRIICFDGSQLFSQLIRGNTSTLFGRPTYPQR
jgi:hypothetical protein